MRRLTKDTGVFMGLCNFFVIPAAEVQQILAENGQGPTWGHACLIETSVSEVFGAEVREDKLKGHIPGGYPKALSKFMPVPPPGISFADFEYKPTAEGHWGKPGPDSPGPMGDPRGHSGAIGERVIRATIDPIVQLIESIKDMPVEMNPNFLAAEKHRG